MSDLEPLRESIRQIDQDLIELVARRMQLAREVGRIKRENNVPLRDWEVERQVLDRAAKNATRHDLQPTFVRQFMQQVIAESRATQERAEFSTYRGTATDIVVIGGRGRMGSWLVDFFANQGHRVQVVDRRDDADTVPLSAAAAQAEVAVIATPLAVVPETIAELAASGYRGIACDVASLKSHLVPAVDAAQAAGIAYTSLHPMFGPGVRTLSDQVLVLCDCGNTAATQRLRDFFADTAATLVELSFTDHDRVATYVLGLSHFVNIVIARTLQQSGLPYDLLERIGSTTFHSQMVTTATVIREQPELYYQIQQLNHFSETMYAAFADEVAALQEAVREGNQDQFVTRMSAARNWMDAT